ncbi:b(0,+)-type amino acid transporter 1-like isoform X1 [Haliotis asinina]|uniref:b(0,+)-type amino acid transporter 1-like isoform X1 n=2 Tax=Haliotis asinina TaxID=109174 RepID=UPI003531FF9B
MGTDQSSKNMKDSCTPCHYSKVPQHKMSNGKSSDARYRGVPKDSDCNGSVIVEESTVSLKKRVGLISGTALIVGTMIGSGIFISPKGVLHGTGSVGLSLMVWVGCGLISLCGALTYAELGTMITKSGAEYAYILEASHTIMPKWLAPIPGFLFAWVSILILKPALFGVVALSFGIYVAEPFFDGCSPPGYLVKLISILCMMVVSFINCYSVEWATKVQNFFTFTKLLALVMIIVGGFYKMSKGNTEFLSEGFEDTVKSPSLIALAFYDGLWAYDGWNNLNYITEELINPNVNLPRSIIIGIPLVTICYLLTNVAYLSIMSKEELLASDAVAATWGSRVLGPAAVLIPIFVACSTFGAANGSCFTGGRLVYSAAREGHLPEILSYVHIRQYTPLPSLVFTTIIAIVMIIPGDIFSLIDFFSFTAWLFYGATMASLIILRFTQKERARPYKVPIFIPIITLCISVYLVIAPIVQNPRIEFFYAFMFIIGGLVFYIPFVHFKLKIRCLDRVTTWLQMVMEVAPSKYEPAE